MSDETAAEVKSRQVGGDDLIEDIFGLNLRGLKTLWVMFASPSKAFVSARSPDWMNRSYTPSIRLLFSLLAVMTATRFLWAGADSSIYEVIEVELANTGAFETEDALQTATASIVDYYLLLFPVCFLACQAIASLLVRVWGKGTNTIVRVRLYMLAILPNATVTLISLPAMKFMTTQQQMLYSLALFPVVFLLDFITSFRGGVVSPSRAMRLIKSVIFASVSNATAILANTVCVMLASIVAGSIMGLGD